jgi:putative component of membrane protein insertase Oxa1/YidC/SpoIIIJ protein YidD
MKGSTKTFWRVLRCNPFSQGGYDPVERTDKIGEEK